MDDVWNYHAAANVSPPSMFSHVGLNKRYRRCNSLEDYERKAQAAALRR